MKYSEIFHLYDGFPRYTTCDECGREYSVDWIECPYCHSKYADHVIIRLKPDTNVASLQQMLRHRTDVDDVLVVRNMDPDHGGFKYVQCISCGNARVSPEQRVCFSCVENARMERE